MYVAECNTEGFYCRNLCKEETFCKSLWQI